MWLRLLPFCALTCQIKYALINGKRSRHEVGKNPVQYRIFLQYHEGICFPTGKRTQWYFYFLGGCFFNGLF